MLQQFAHILIFAGVLLAAAGIILYLLGRPGLGKLPCDMSFGGKGWRVYVPLGSSILLSILLTVLMAIVLYILSRFRR